MGEVSKLSSTLSRLTLGGNLASPPNVVFTQEDMEHCGLWGIDRLQVLYRVCRDDEDLDNDIVSKVGPSPPQPSSTPKKEVSKKEVPKKEVSAKKAVNQHIHSGHIPTQFISCTASRVKALEWAFYTKGTPYDIQDRPIPRRIIMIHISRIPPETASQIINLTREVVLRHFVSGSTQINRAKSSHEVLFQWRIPKKNSRGEDVFELWQHPELEKPPKPQSRNKK